MQKEQFGFCDKGSVDAYHLKNSAGMEAVILTFGGIVQKLLVPAGGEKVDVCLGYDTLKPYLTDRCYYGALIGPQRQPHWPRGIYAQRKEYQRDGHSGHGTSATVVGRV